MIVRLCLVAALVLAGAACARAEDAGGAVWGSPSVDGGKCCRSLGEVRDHIDALDRQILGLMAERQKYVGEAGRFKKVPASVSAPARVEAIIAKARGIAREDGLAESVAERTYRAMIAAFEDYERAEWTRRNPNGAPAR